MGYRDLCDYQNVQGTLNRKGRGKWKSVLKDRLISADLSENQKQ